MTKHAILSASGAHRWLNCPPSAQLERQFSEQPSAAAKEGTTAHALAEQKLRGALGLSSLDEEVLDVDEEMERYTNDYVDFVLESIESAKLQCPDPRVLIEQKLDFSEFVPEGFGTGDCIIVGDGSLHVIDFKYGQGVVVECEDNPQMKLYALGALNLFDVLYDIDEIAMSIFQPRRDNISTSRIKKEELLHWAENELRPVAKQAYVGEGEYRSGDWCRFCRAAVQCRARAKEKLDLCRYEFALPPTLTDEEIGTILGTLDDLTIWANDIKTYALEMAVRNAKRWDGFKLVEGRSNRKYIDEEKVAEAAIASGYTDIYRQSLITLTEMEKQMGKKKFNEILGDLVEKPRGKPTLVPITDKRPEMIIENAKQDFMEEQ